MEREGGLGSRMERDSHHHILKPLVNGCLTGLIHASMWNLARILQLPSFKNTHKLGLRMNFLFGVTHTTASLGLFEILTKEVKNSNNGRPLSLYQEANCGLTSGLIASLVWQPLLSGFDRVGPNNLTYTKLFTNLSHTVTNQGVLALWRGSSWAMGERTVTIMGMLASYNPALNHLRASESISNSEAQIIGAGIISGFFGAACAHPCRYLGTIKDVAKKRCDGGEKDVYRHVSGCVARILTPYSGFRFYRDFLITFHRMALFATAQLWIYEQILAREESESTPESGRKD